MSFKLQPTSDTLCLSCRFANIAEFSNGDRMIGCLKFGNFELSKIIPYPVIKCNVFENKNSATEWEMRQIAWDVKVSSKGGFIGFEAPPKEDR